MAMASDPEASPRLIVRLLGPVEITLTTEPPNADAIQTLTQALLDMPHGTRLGAWLFTVTDGQPFYLTETVHELIEQHEIIRDATGKWALPQPDWTPPSSYSFPARWLTPCW